MNILRHKKTLLIVLSLMFLVSGCKSKTSTGKITDPALSSNSASTPNNPTGQKYYAPYTGEEVSKEVANNVAFMSIIENAPAARPQSGFTEADIVYEAMAEGGITRCLALYQKDNSAKIGPVRSMRTYFIDLAYEYNLPFAHCGGSHDALDRIKNENPMSLDEMYNGAFYWRDQTIKIQEHNLYTSTDKMKALISEKGYIKSPTVKLNFDKAYWDTLNATVANNVIVKFNGEYTTAYSFKDGLYYKSMNKVPTLNKENSKPVAVKNVVIQKVNYRTRTKELYLDADLVGQGDGYIISNGKAQKVTWSKADLHSQTIFKDETGKLVPLNPGKTWWHLLDQNANLTIN
jgi:hypothetical protein